MMKRVFIFLIAIAAVVELAQARQPQRGYRGFVEWSNDLRTQKRIGTDMAGNQLTGRECLYYTGLTTSHGYQINPLFFVGIGVGLERSVNDAHFIAPIFAHGRIDLKFGKFTPFGDIRLGANLSDGVSVYFSPTIGYRFNWGRKLGINLGAGLSLAGYKTENYNVTEIAPEIYDIQYLGTSHHVRPYFSFRLGIDF